MRMKGTELLGKLETRLKSQMERVVAVCEGLSDDDFGAESEPGVWGIGQILAHLNMATEAYLPLMGASISRGVDDKGDPIKHSTLAGLMLKGMHRPGIPVPGSMVPSGSRSRKDLETWTENSDRVLQLMDQAKGKDLVTNRFKNPFFQIGKFNLADGFAIIVEHNERHIRQMEERIEKIRGLAASV